MHKMEKWRKLVWEPTDQQPRHNLTAIKTYCFGGVYKMKQNKNEEQILNGIGKQNRNG